MHIRRRLLSQNFLHNRKLVKKLLGLSSIGKNDLVLEIGPGDGIILEELMQTAGQVIGIEIDFDLYKSLQQKYQNKRNLSLYLGDVLSLPTPRGPYKVFSNIPFAIEGKLIRKFLDDKNPPEDCYLVIRRDLAERLCKKNTMFNVSYAPFFEFSIMHNFNRHDFHPTPRVQAALFRFKKREKPILSWEEKKRYQEFISIAFGNRGPVYQNLKNKSYILRNFGISKQAKRNEFRLENWIKIYRSLIS